MTTVENNARFAVGRRLDTAAQIADEYLEAHRAYCYAANAAERRDAAERVAEAEQKQRELDAVAD